MKDFFVSYTGKDVNYATWVAKLLEDNGYTVTIQAWDFLSGDNFVANINKALIECKKLIVILSESYLKSKWCEIEWTAKLSEQIKLDERRIIPIRIEPIEVKGLLSPISYINIVDNTEDEAKQKILEDVKDQKPRIDSGFPSYYNLEYIKIDIDYYVESSVITYIKTCKIKMLSECNNKIHNRITWFIDEDVSLESLTENVSIEYLNLRDTNLNYNVVFDHEIQKGEEIEYRIKAVLTNNKNHFENFFSSEIIAPVANLDIHLNLSNKLIKKVYTQKISSSPMNKRTEQPEEHLFYSPFHWLISNPEINFEYKIYW